MNRLLLLEFLLAGSAALLLAQQPRNPNPDQLAPAPVYSLPPQQTGPDDLISIMVSDCPELSRRIPENSDGRVVLPLLEHHMIAAG